MYGDIHVYVHTQLQILLEYVLADAGLWTGKTRDGSRVTSVEVPVPRT